MILNLNYFFIFFFLFFNNFSNYFSYNFFFFFTKKKTKNIRRKSLYECGFESFGDSHVLINIQFIIIGLIIKMLKTLFILLKIIQKHNFNKYIFKIYKFINLKLVFIFLQIFKNIQIKIYGIDLWILFKKKNVLNNLQIFKKKSNFLFKILVDLVIYKKCQCEVL